MFRESNDTRVSCLQAVPQCASLLVRTLVLVTRRDFKIPRFKDQRYAILLCVALKKTGSETVAMLREACGNNTMSQNMIYHRNKANNIFILHPRSYESLNIWIFKSDWRMTFLFVLLRLNISNSTY